jgi:hypothetical protein
VWGHERRGTRLMAAATAGIKRAIRTTQVLCRGEFLHSANERPIIPRSRMGMNVGPERVAPEELMAAAKVVLGATDFLDEEELVAEVREILGLKRTQDGSERIQESIRVLLQQGSLIYGVAGLRLRPASNQT